MTDREDTQPDPSVVPPAPIEEEPSTTGVVADDDAADASTDSDADQD